MGKGEFIIALILFNIIFIAFISAIIIFIRQYRIKKKTHLSEIQDIDETHRKALLETEIEIRTQTMKHIGREIHDNIGQKLTLASLYTQQLAIAKKPDIQKNAEQINDIIDQSLTELRQLSKSLTDNTIDEKSIVKLIDEECIKINALKKYIVQFTNDPEIHIESYTIKSILLRITQEFIQNSMKHGQCKHITVSLVKKLSSLQLLLKDDGIGFDMDTLQSNGIGLKNIKKRVALIGGTMQLESQNKLGTALTIEIPIS